MEDPEWNRLCLHAIARSVALGNVQLAPILSTQAAIYFRGVFSVSAIHDHLILANWQLFAFSLAGWLGRCALLQDPNWYGALYNTGLLIWVLGLATNVAFGGASELAHVASLVVSSIGGGVYFWCSIDDTIVSAKMLGTKDLILIIFGCLSTSYVNAAQWTLTDIARASPGFPLIYTIFLLIAAPLCLLVFLEEARRSPRIFVPPPATPLSPLSPSFCLHVTFLFVFGIFRNVPALSLFLPINFSPAENALLVFLRWTGVLIGELTFLVVFDAINLPVTVSIILPFTLLAWGSLGDRYEISALSVLIYGYCIGTLGVWALHRVLQEWNRHPSEPTLHHLNPFMYTISVALLPGDLFLNLFASIMLTSSSALLVWPAFGLSVLNAALIAMHWVVYTIYKE